MSQLNDFIATYIARMPSIRWVDIVEILLIAFLIIPIDIIRKAITSKKK